MTEITVDKLNIGDYLAKTVKDVSGKIILYEGTRIGGNELRHLKGNGIRSVCIFEEMGDVTSAKKEIIKEEMRKDCRQNMKKIVSGYVCSADSSLKEITETSGDIIEEIYENERVASKVYEIKQRTPDIYEHCVNVCALSILTAMKLNVSRDMVSDVGIGSLLHDLGLKYLTIDYFKSQDELTYEDLFEYKKHTLYGFASVENEHWMSTVSKRIILQHHEKVDGTGYPFRQKNMPLEVKIVAACDALDDMICGIGYNGMRVHEALEKISEDRDTYYDGRVVDTILSFIVAYPTETRLILNTREEAVVIAQNPHYTYRPTVRVTKSEDGEPMQREKIINLSENREYDIESVL